MDSEFHPYVAEWGQYPNPWYLMSVSTRQGSPPASQRAFDCGLFANAIQLIALLPGLLLRNLNQAAAVRIYTHIDIYIYMFICIYMYTITTGLSDDRGN